MQTAVVIRTKTAFLAPIYIAGATLSLKSSIFRGISGSSQKGEAKMSCSVGGIHGNGCWIQAASPTAGDLPSSSSYFLWPPERLAWGKCNEVYKMAQNWK